MGTKLRCLAAAAFAMAVFVPAGGVQASHTCTSSVVIFSAREDQGQSAGSVNSNALVCIVGSDLEDTYDGRIINPGSNRVSIRYTEDLGEDYPTLSVRLNGLGLDNEVVTAARQPFTTGGFLYNTPRVPIDETATGDITATVFLLDDEGAELVIDENTFHTLGS
jgi:hypothetical protein